MDQRLSLVTLAVADMARARAFYEAGLGWAPMQAMDEVTFFQLPGIAFGLFERKAFEADTGQTIDGVFGGMAVAINLPGRAEVDALFEQARAAGATIAKAPVASPWGGYSGYFADPDGHLWEVAHNPFWTINPDGTTTAHAPA